MPTPHHFFFVLFRLIAGVLSGMFVLGGGLIVVPAMGFMGIDFKTATETSLATQLLPYST